MGRIPDNVIQEILDKADIESVVGEYVTFQKRSGSNLFACCPFHSEKTPSFSVSPSRQIYYCFGCHKGGNAINFIMELEHLSYPEAIRFLGNKLGIDVPEDDYGRDNDKAVKDKKKRISALLNESARYFYLCLNSTNHEAEEARKYAAKRNLSKDTLRRFGIGYAPRGYDNLYKHLKSKGYTDDELKDSGLFTVSAKNGKLYDLFKGRLMFPIFDFFGTIVAFGGRALGDEMPKYINSPDSFVYKKQEHLYALNFAKEDRPKQLIIVEGYMDAISMHQAGVTNAVASLGTAFTDAQLRMCARLADEVVFFFDADNAGQMAALRAIKMMLSYLHKMNGMKIKIKIAKVPGGKDPDEYIRNEGPEKFREVVNNAKYVDEYLTDRAYEDNYKEGSGLDTERYQDDICLYGSWLNDEIKRSKMAGNASVYLKARPDIILKQMDGLAENASSQNKIMEQRSLERGIKAEIQNREIENSAETAAEPDADKASEDEIYLLAYAVNLRQALSDEKRIDREDVLRPSDFLHKNMQDIVTFFLNNYKPDRGCPEPVLMGELRKYVINGKPAEEVFFNPLMKGDSFDNLTVLCDMYKKTLYKVRLNYCKQLEKALVARLSVASSEEREAINDKLRKIELFRTRLSEKGDKI